ncbi:MAG: hypothetical protein CBB97_25575 [Candidatus Endolissoclinum sp. TMED37]|nr:MAG: hypothetical protein CBB97_25575 [Candidatus Endolissoclinum sp. TMED37]
MPSLITLPSFTDERGSLTVIEKIIPFDIKRVYFIYNSEGHKRGFHKHKITRQALIASSGSCSVYVKESKKTIEFKLDEPSKCLILEPEDFHWMDKFTKESVLLVIASEYYNEKDYVEDDLR